MKKRILVTLFAVCLAVCALSITALAAESAPEYVAQIGETKYESIQAAVNAAQDGDTVKVIKSHNLDCTAITNDSLIYISGDKAITIDLNGYTVTADYTVPEAAEYQTIDVIIGVAAGSKLTLTDSSAEGTGTIHGKTTEETAKLECLVANFTSSDNNDGDDGYSLIIDCGNYRIDYGVEGGAIVYASADKTTLVRGGNFSVGNAGKKANASPWMFNVRSQDANRLIVTGGTFNADINHQHYEFEVSISRDLALKKIGESTWTVVNAAVYMDEYHGLNTWYTVGMLPEVFATGKYIRQVGYASLEEAIAAANANVHTTGDRPDGVDYEKITLLKDCTVDTALAINDKIIITVDGEAETTPTVTWNGPGKMFNIQDGKSLAIDAGIYSCDVNEWCADEYAAVEANGLFEVVPGYQVSYYVDGDDTPVYIEGVVTGGKAKGYIHVVEAVEQGEEDNAIFKWYKEAEVQPIVFPLDIVEDTPLHGTLVPAVIVDFETGEGSEVSRQVIEADAENGVEVTEPSAPTKENSTFMGWYADEGLTIEFDFDAAIRDSADIYAKWIDDSIISFETSGGSVVEDVYVPCGEKLEKPLPNPTKSGYTFGGWYVDAELTEKYDFDADIEEESVFTLYAKWDEIVYVPAYSIDAPEGVKISPAYAYPGTTVTVTIEDADLDGVRILNSKGNLIRVNGSDGVFKFVMPYGDVKVEPFALPFDDVSENDYFHDAVIWAIANGITEGTSDTEFSPNADCTRAQMVTFLWRVAGCPEPKASASSFTDVDMDSYYAKAALWAAETGITEGTGEGLFSPDADCSRAEMAVFLSRMTGGKAQGEDFAFSDIAADAYYAEAVQWAAENGITIGTGDGLFSPDAACSRAQMVAFLLRCFNN